MPKLHASFPFKKNKGSLDPELAFAEAIQKIIDPPSLQLKRRNSYVTAGFPGVAAQIVELEKLLIDLAGIPNGWDRPLFDRITPLADIVTNYIESTPATRGREADANREMIAALAKRTPPLNNIIDIPPLEAEKDN